MAPLSSLGLAGAGRSYYKICQESSTIPSDSAIGSQGAEDLLDNVGYESFCDSERDADSLFFLRGGLLAAPSSPISESSETLPLYLRESSEKKR